MALKSFPIVITGDIYTGAPFTSLYEPWGFCKKHCNIKRACLIYALAARLLFKICCMVTTSSVKQR